jgi:hypothetical protein
MIFLRRYVDTVSVAGENDTLRNFVQQSEMINPLEPRDAFYGGRTEAFTLFQKDQDISYVDVTSLYPYINKTGKIPIGHPEIVTEGLSIRARTFR